MVSLGRSLDLIWSPVGLPGGTCWDTCTSILIVFTSIFNSISFTRSFNSSLQYVAVFCSNLQSFALICTNLQSLGAHVGILGGHIPLFSGDGKRSSECGRSIRGRVFFLFQQGKGVRGKGQQRSALPGDLADFLESVPVRARALF